MWRRYGDAAYGLLVLTVFTVEVVTLGVLTVLFSMGLLGRAPGAVLGEALIGAVGLTGLAVLALTLYVLAYHGLTRSRERHQASQLEAWTEVWVRALYRTGPLPPMPLPRPGLRAGLEMRELLGGEDGRAFAGLLERAGVGDDLLASLRSRGRVRRLEALDGLGWARFPSAFNPLLDHVRTAPSEVERLMASRAAARTLAEFPAGPERESGAAAFAGTLARSGLPAGAAGEMLLLLDKAAPPVLERPLAIPELPVPLLRAGVDAIGRLGLVDLSGVPAGVAAHPDPEVRASALRAMGRIGTLPGDAGESVVRSLHDDIEFVRVQATRAAGLLPRRTALPALWNGLGDPSWWVRRASAESLHRLGEPGALTLRQAAARHPDRFARDMAAQVLRDAAASTGAAGGPEEGVA